MSRGVQGKKKHIAEVPKTYSDLHENYYSGDFTIADYRSSIRFKKKFKMADLIWRSSFIKINQILTQGAYL